MQIPDKISILIITYNRPMDLFELLKNLNTQQRTNEVLAEILVLNNASTEPYTDVEAYITAHPELKINYIPSKENLGVARGRNELMKIAKGKLMLVVDDDVVFTKPDDLYKLGFLYQDPYFIDANTGVISLRVLYYDTMEVQITGFPHKKYEKYKDTPRFFTSYFIGCAHLMKREVLAKTGLYPTDFHYGMEEYDLSYRILNAGYTIGFDNGVTILHKESPLGRAPNFRKLQMQWVNKSKVAWRYLPFRYFVSTALAWGWQYLKLIKGHFGTFILTIGQIFRIPFTQKRSVVSEHTLEYLNKVEARLKY